MLNGPAGVPSANSLGGILGATLGESPAEQAARIEEAKKTATDLTGLVRHKKKSAGATPEPSTNGTNGKRKAEDGEAGDNAKKAKVEDAPEE